MIMSLLVGLAWGHGGEDHAAPAAPSAALATGARVPTWSSEFEAVLVLPQEAEPGEELDATLLLADWGTSAPISAGQVQLELDGPASLQLELAPSPREGVWPFHVTFPAPGEYSGGLTVLTPERSDMLGLPAFPIEEHTHGAAGLGWGTVAGGALGGLALGLLIGLGVRRFRRPLAASGLVLGMLLAQKVLAHGGEDHGPPTAPTAARAGGDLQLNLDSQFLLEVRTTRATERPFAEHVRALGITVAPPGGSAELHAPVTGVLSIPEAGLLAPGAVVTAGQTLATIAESLGGADRSSVVDARTAAQVRLAQARSAVALAERDVQQAASLGDVLSGKDKLARQQALEVAREELKQAQIGAQSLSGFGSSVVIKAPISGRIASMLARPGDVVSPGDVLYRIVGEGGLWVQVSAPVLLAGRLTTGARATVESDARPGERFSATVLDPGLEADPGTGTVTVTLALDGSAGLIPGMPVTASIVSGAERTALTVPDGAVVDSGGESLVFVKTGPETFQARTVRVGGRSDEQREILAGLEPGARVVVQGTYTLRSLAGR
jgi:cobalt-zinc-cadmium efflux system membrane fusion protein